MTVNAFLTLDDRRQLAAHTHRLVRRPGPRVGAPLPERSVPDV